MATFMKNKDSVDPFYTKLINPRPTGVGILYPKMVRDEEEDAAFFAKKDEQSVDILSQYKQDFPKFTYSNEGFIVHEPSNDGAGKLVVFEKTKAPDFDKEHFTLTAFPGLKPNDNISKVVHKSARWINAFVLAYEVSRAYKQANQKLFGDECGLRFTWMDVLGELDLWKDQIGLCYNDAKLKRISSKPFLGVSGWVGNFPQHGNASCAFPVGALGNFKLSCEIKTRPLTELIVNEFIGDAAGLFATPLDSCTGEMINSSSIKTLLAVKYVWVDDAEKSFIQNNYRECKFKEMRLAGDHTIEPSTKRRCVDIDLNCIGIGTQFIVTIQEEDDIANGLVFKTNGTKQTHHIHSAMLYYNDKPAEDALPAEFLAGAQIINTWRVTPKRVMYLVQVYENNARSTIFSGGRNMTVFQKLKMSLDVKPNDVTLIAQVHMLGWQNYYTHKNIAYLSWV